jgi:hypothetical protein
MASKSKKSPTPRRKRVPVASAPAVGLEDAYNTSIAWWTAYDALDDLDLGTTLEDVLAVPGQDVGSGEPG